MTDLQAALGASQVQRLDEFVAARNSLASSYVELLREFPVEIVEPLDGSLSAQHLFIIR